MKLSTRKHVKAWARIQNTKKHVLYENITTVHLVVVSFLHLPHLVLQQHSKMATSFSSECHSLHAPLPNKGKGTTPVQECG